MTSTTASADADELEAVAAGLVAAAGLLLDAGRRAREVSPDDCSPASELGACCRRWAAALRATAHLVAGAARWCDPERIAAPSRPPASEAGPSSGRPVEPWIGLADTGWPAVDVDVLTRVGTAFTSCAAAVHPLRRRLRDLAARRTPADPATWATYLQGNRARRAELTVAAEACDHLAEVLAEATRILVEGREAFDRLHRDDHAGPPGRRASRHVSAASSTLAVLTERLTALTAPVVLTELPDDDPGVDRGDGPRPLLPRAWACAAGAFTTTGGDTVPAAGERPPEDHALAVRGEIELITDRPPTASDLHAATVLAARRPRWRPWLPAPEATLVGSLEEARSDPRTIDGIEVRIDGRRVLHLAPARPDGYVADGEPDRWRSFVELAGAAEPTATAQELLGRLCRRLRAALEDDGETVVRPGVTDAR